MIISTKDEYSATRLFRTISAIIISFLLVSCSRDKIKLSTEFVEFNTAIKFTAYQIDPSSKAETESLFYKAGNLLGKINSQLDPDLLGSEVEKLNSTAYNQTLPLSITLQSLKDKTLFIAALTDSSFDPAVYPIFDKWGFSIGNNPQIPDSLELQRLTKAVSLRNVRFYKDSVKMLSREVKLGFGAIAKGWAADSIATFFKNNGLNDFIVAASGDIVINSTTKKIIAVKHPRSDSQYLDTVYIDKGAISTSGDYERFFENNGKRYCHIINPRTGYPDSDCLSVTVITDAGWKSDALATGIFVMGRTKGETFMRKNNLSGIISYYTDEKQVARIEINLKKYKQK